MTQRPTAEERVSEELFKHVMMHLHPSTSRPRLIHADVVVQLMECHAQAEVEAATAELRRERDEARAELAQIKDRWARVPIALQLEVSAALASEAKE